MTGWTYNWVSQLRQRGHENWLLLADGERTCSILQQGWMPMVLQHGEAPLPCIWSSYPGSHPGWSQWGKLQGNDDLYRVYMFWSTRWWVALNLLRQGLNVLSLDVDAALLSDVYQLLHSPPLSNQVRDGSQA